MRKIQKNGQEQLTELVCNRCGRKIKLAYGAAAEGVCAVRVDWGYFSAKDGERHAFDLCEDCYDEMVRGFAIPVEVEERTELL